MTDVPMTPAEQVLIDELCHELRVVFDDRPAEVIGMVVSQFIAEWLVQVARDRAHAEKGLEVLVRGVKRHMRLSYAGG